MSNQALIAYQKFELAPIQGISNTAIAIKERVLTESALIATVKTAEQNKQCFEARRNIEQLSRDLERERKRITDPINDWLRQTKAAVDKQREELDQEAARLALLEKDFNLAEQRRVFEEKEAQRRELDRIEREKQEELLRIAREQAEIERKAAEAARLAEEQAAMAKNKSEREKAEKARIEAEQRVAEAAQKAIEQSRLATERAELAAAIESKPVEATKAKGQVVSEVWVIDQINDHQLYKERPDLVRKFEWDLIGLKQALTEGKTYRGLIAHKETKMGGRATRQPIIDI